MRQRVLIKLEKKLACDLKPGELFVMEPIEPRDIQGSAPMLQVFMRTNISEENFSDMDVLVYKVHIVIVNPEDPVPPRLDPHSPPGVKGNGR